MRTKEFVITIIFIITLLIIYGVFPVRNTFQQFIIMIVFFIIIPIIFNKFILKKKLTDIGIKIGNWKQGFIWSGISAVIIGAIFLIAAYFFDFFKNYTVPSSIVASFKNFLFYEVMLVAPIIFLYEFFFRGFIVLTLKNTLSYWAIIIQGALFLLLVIATGSFNWALFPYLASALLAGVIVYKSGSIFYAAMLQFIVIIVLDANIIRLVN